MSEIFVSTYPFGKADSFPRQLLETEHGFQVKYNSLQRKMTSREVADYARSATAIIAGTEDLSILIEESTSLRLISRVGIGLDSVNLHLCRSKGIRVCYTPDAVTLAVAELTIGLMIDITRKISLADDEIRNAVWTRHYGKRIGKSTIGLIGFGRVGQNVARLILPFGCKILVNDKKDISRSVSDFTKLGLDIQSVSKEKIYADADIVSLHLPAYSETKHMINKKTLLHFKNSTFLINTARGELIDEVELNTALLENRLAGAALDVFENEPYSGNLIQLQNVILTQHMGSCSFDCRLAMETEATEDCIRFLKGEPLLREVPESEYEYQNH